MENRFRKCVGTLFIVFSAVPCQSECHPNATCVFENGTAKCFCDVGFRGDGVSVCDDTIGEDKRDKYFHSSISRILKQQSFFLSYQQ